MKKAELTFSPFVFLQLSLLDKCSVSFSIVLCSKKEESEKTKYINNSFKGHRILNDEKKIVIEGFLSFVWLAEE